MNRLHLVLRLALMIVVISAGLLCISRGEPSAQLTAAANHDRINIDFFYHGSTVVIHGISDPGTDLVIKITSEGGHHTLRQKGKVGVLWMNVGTLKFNHVPSVYFLQSTKNIDDILTSGEQVKHGLGYRALAGESEVTSSEDTKDTVQKERWFNEFLKYKEASKVYAVAAGKISLTQKDGGQDYYTAIDWPYQAPPGDYMVTVYAVKDKKVVEQAGAKVTVQQVGTIKALAAMAKNNGAFYGFIAVLAALGAGFGVGLIFRKGGGGH